MRCNEMKCNEMKCLTNTKDFEGIFLMREVLKDDAATMTYIIPVMGVPFFIKDSMKIMTFFDDSIGDDI